jgi:hypothetical protein
MGDPMESFQTNNSSGNPTPPGLPSVPPPKKINKRYFWLIGLVAVLVFGLLSANFYLGKREEEQEKKAQEVLRSIKQKQMDAEKHKHDLVLEHIQAIKDHGISLPPCPLVYPLLDAKGKVTPLGSYLSYFSMKCATYLPQEVYLLPNPGEAFNDFHLFDVQKTDHGKYISQLSYRLGTKDFAKGTLTKTSKGYRIRLKFSRGSKNKKYEKIFDKGKLHLATAWMASCIHDWTGFHSDAAENTYLGKPVFANDEDLLRGSNLEWMFRGGGAKLVNRWDEILNRNPENPFLVDRWATIQIARDDVWVKANLFGLYDPLIAKSPNNTFVKISYADQLESVGLYDNALDQLWSEMVKDDNNPDFYYLARLCLEGKGYYPECYELMKGWVNKHPENARAWMGFAEFMCEYAWQARGGGYANTVPQEAWKVFFQRIKEGVDSAEKATQLEPNNSRTWGELVAYSNGAEFDDETFHKYFKEAIRCDPGDSWNYTSCLEHLQPKWGGSVEDLFGFAEKYKKEFPILYLYAFSDLFSYCGDNSPESRKKWRADLRVLIKQKPVFWKKFRMAYQAKLKQNPENVGTWQGYVNWMSENDEERSVLNDVKKLMKVSPELNALYPYMVLNLNNKIEELQSDQDKKEKGNYLSQQPAVQKTNMAYSQLLKLDPHNWNIWNRMARFSYQGNDLEKCREAFNGIGDHWDEAVWDKATFDKAKAAAMNPPTPSSTPNSH